MLDLLKASDYISYIKYDNLIKVNAMIDLKQQLEDIQAEASAKMEKLFQDEFQRVFDSLVTLYPKRDIKITFGNGTMIVEGFESTRRYIGFADMFGILQSYSDCLNLGTLDKFPKDHPLI